MNKMYGTRNLKRERKNVQWTRRQPKQETKLSEPPKPCNNQMDGVRINISHILQQKLADYTGGTCLDNNSVNGEAHEGEPSPRNADSVGKRLTSPQIRTRPPVRLDSFIESQKLKGEVIEVACSVLEKIQNQKKPDPVEIQAVLCLLKKESELIQLRKRLVHIKKAQGHNIVAPNTPNHLPFTPPQPISTNNTVQRATRMPRGSITLSKGLRSPRRTSIGDILQNIRLEYPANYSSSKPSTPVNRLKVTYKPTAPKSPERNRIKPALPPEARGRRTASNEAPKPNSPLKLKPSLPPEARQKSQLKAIGKTPVVTVNATDEARVRKALYGATTRPKSPVPRAADYKPLQIRVKPVIKRIDPTDITPELPSCTVLLPLHKAKEASYER